MLHRMQERRRPALVSLQKRLPKLSFRMTPRLRGLPSQPWSRFTHESASTCECPPFPRVRHPAIVKLLRTQSCLGLYLGIFKIFDKGSFCYVCLVGKDDSDDSESNEHIKKRTKRVQQSPKSKRATCTVVTKKDTSKSRAKPSVHVTVDSSSSTSPTDDQVRKLTVKGKALKGRLVRDPEDDERILVSRLQSRNLLYCSSRPPSVGVDLGSCAPVVVSSRTWCCHG